MTTRNELQSFEDEFFKRIRERDAWKKISGESDFPWSERIIGRNADNWDWKELCENQAINWSEELLEKYKTRIDWNALSRTICGNGYCSKSPSTDWDVIKKFESYWNWKVLSDNGVNIQEDIMEKFADRWDWSELIDNGNINWSFELFDKFKRYIPISDFDHLKQSVLWRKLVEIDAQVLKGRILSN